MICSTVVPPQIAKAISLALQQMEKSSTTIAEAVQIWLSLLDNDAIAQHAKAKKVIGERSLVVLKSGM